MNPPDDHRDHLRALIGAYNEVTGFSLALTPFRVKVLKSVDKLGIGPDDVRLVMLELKRLVVADPKHYPEASLDFNNAVANVERLEERANRLRQRAAKKKKSAAAMSAPVTAVVKLSAEEEARIREDAKRRGREVREKLGGCPK